MVLEQEFYGYTLTIRPCVIREPPTPHTHTDTHSHSQTHTNTVEQITPLADLFHQRWFREDDWQAWLVICMALGFKRVLQVQESPHRWMDSSPCTDAPDLLYAFALEVYVNLKEAQQHSSDTFSAELYWQGVVLRRFFFFFFEIMLSCNKMKNTWLSVWYCHIR